MSAASEERRVVAGTDGSTGERRVVVGVDGSQPSRHALQWARFMARVLDARIDAVTVWEISAVVASAAWDDDWNPEKEAAANLQATVAEILGSGPRRRSARSCVTAAPRPSWWRPARARSC